MFETLQKLDDNQLDSAARTLQSGHPFMVLVDPAGVFCMFKPCPEYSVDFVCVKRKRFEDGYKLQRLTPLQHSVLETWLKMAVPSICRRWKELDKAQ